MLFSKLLIPTLKEAPQEVTGQCNIWKNYVDFPVGKM